MNKICLCLIYIIFNTYCYSQNFVVSDIEYEVLQNDKDCVAVFSAKYNKLDSIEIPASVEHQGTQYTVVGIGDYAFRWKTRLSSVVLPNTVRYIGIAAFLGCISLSDVQLSDSLSAINSAAFMGCTGLQSINLPESLTYLGEKAFKETGLNSLAIPQNINTVAYGLCSDCFSLSSVTLQSSVTSIEEGAFAQCSSLRSFILPDSLVELGPYAFANCTALEQIEIPEGVGSINFATFYRCQKLNKVSFSKNIKRIGDAAFLGCKMLKTVVLPDSLQVINREAFKLCEKLSNITFPRGLQRVSEYAFMDTDWFFKKAWGMVYIRDIAYCYRGTMPPNSTIRLQEGTRYISDGAFRNCDGLISVILPKSVESMGDEYGIGIFGGCTNLREIHVESIRPPSAYDFGYDQIDLSEITLYVPTGTSDTYFAAPYWRTFANIQEDISTGIRNVNPYEHQNNGMIDLLGRGHKNNQNGVYYEKEGIKIVM